MSRKFVAFSVIVALLLMLTPALAPNAAAQPAPAGPQLCDELQVIFVVDQSGSMFGFTNKDGVRVPATDPDGFRYRGAERAAELLGALHHVSFEDANFQLATVYFGDKPQTVMPWQALNPQDDVENDALQASLKQFFTPLDDSYGNTLPLRAVQTASSLFAQVTPQTDGCPTRSVIVITDGRPASGGNGFSPDAHLAQIQQYVETVMPYPDHQIYVIGLDENGSYFDGTRSQWVGVAGDPARVKKVTSAQAMRSEINRIVNELLRTVKRTGTGYISACITGENFEVPPFMQKLEIDFTKEDSSKSLALTDPEGRSNGAIPGFSIEKPDPFVEKATILNPAPGFWTLDTPLTPEELANCQVSLIGISATEKVVKPQNNQEYVQFSTLDIEFEIVDDQDRPLQDYPGVNYSMNVKLVASTDEQSVSEAIDLGQAYEVSVPIMYAGENQLIIQPTSFMGGMEYWLYGDLGDGEKPIANIQVTPVDLYVDQSVPDAPEQYEAYPFSIGFKTENAPFNVRDESTAEFDFIVEVQREGGSPVQVTGQLGADGAYETEIQFEDGGEHVIRYSAEVQDPANPDIVQSFGPYEITVGVNSVDTLRGRITSDENLVVTTMWGPLQPATGLAIEIQLEKLTDQGWQPVNHADVAIGDFSEMFDVVIKDSNGEIVSQGLIFQQGGAQGLYSLSPNTLGRGEYSVTVDQAGSLQDLNRWDTSNVISQSVTGRFHEWFKWVALALALLLALLIAAALWIASLFRYPLSGRLAIMQMEINDDGTTTARQMWVQTLPNRNTVVYRPNIPGRRGIASNIRRIKVNTQDASMAKAKRARVEVRIKGEKRVRTATLTPGGVGLRLGGSLVLVKDPNNHPDGSYSTANLGSTFDGGAQDGAPTQRSLNRDLN